MLNTLIQDLKYGLHLLAKKPGFTFVAVLTLALGVGANTALFSIVDEVLLKKLPVRNPDELVLFTWTASKEFSPGSYTGSGGRDPVTGLPVRTSFAYSSYQRLRDAQSGLSDLVAFGSLNFNVAADSQVDVAEGQAVSGNYYSALGVPAFLGRTIDENDDRAGARPVAVISHRFWQTRFGSDPTVIGKQINLNQVPFTIAGVTPPQFIGTGQVGNAQDVSIPIAWEEQVSGDFPLMKGAGVWWLRVMGRLKPGVSRAQVQAALAGTFMQSVLDHRQARVAQNSQNSIRPLEQKDYPRLILESGSQGEMNTRRHYEKPLRLLFGVVGLVLLIACANVANLLLVRASSRRREIAVRIALGASRLRLIRQLLTESMLLSIISGAVGVVFAVWIKDGLLSVDSWGGKGTALNPRLDLRVLAFTFGLSLLTGILFGVMPALRATRMDLTPALKDSARGSSAATRSFLSKSLVVAQVSISLLLLIGAGLLLRTLVNLQHVDSGFNANNLMLFTVNPRLIGYKEDRLANLYQQMSDRLEALPGVKTVTFSRMALLAEGSSDRSFFLPSATAEPDGTVKPTGNVYLHQVRENFLEAMEIPLLMGRRLSTTDDARAQRVAIINQTMAQKYFPDENPIGKRLYFSSDKTDGVEIVGLSKDAKYTAQRDEVPPTAYLPWRQEMKALGTATFEIRTTGDPEAALAGIRDAAKAVDPNLPLSNVKSQVEQAEDTLMMERLFAKLLTLFGLLAQQLASIGLYGVLAYSVSQRTHEIGIRMALGADRQRVLRMILTQGMSLTLIGITLGVGGAYVLTKYLGSLTTMLFGVEAHDPWTYGLAAGLLSVVGLLACFVPARRATRVDPLVALRYE